MRLFPTKRGWKYLGIGTVSLVALALIANGFMIWRTDARLQARIDAIRAVGDPATIADLAPEPIPAEQNAAAQIDKLVPRLAAFDKELAHFYDRTPIGQAYDAARRRDESPNAEQLAAIRAILDKYPDIETGIAAAAACPRYASLIDFSVNHHQLIEDSLERVQKIRTAARFAAWRMDVLTSEGQVDAAVRLGIQVLQLARLFNSEPLLISHLVGVAVRMTVAQPLYEALATGKVSPEALALLEKELVLQDDPGQLVHVLKTEQAFGISVASEGGIVPQMENVNPVWFKLVGWPMKKMFVDSLDVYDDYLELARKPWHEIHYRFGPHGAITSPGQGVLGALLSPALGATFIAQSRSQAGIRSLRIATALARYRQENGREATGLSDLSLPSEATVDPFSGEPLKLKHTDEGWLIYTVMQNDIDDGGDFTDQMDWGLAPRKKPAKE